MDKNSLKHYLGYSFRERYKEYLKDSRSPCPYKDIDSVGVDTLFYNNLTAFLNKTLKPFKFLSPGPTDYPFAIKFEDEEDKMEIYLTSDQFGFSALQNSNKKATWNGEKYPYARYLQVDCNASGAKDIEKIELVTECIYETRTIGGSFLWPKVKTGRWQSRYNIERGAGGYIEDRVDMTLYEIKCFYDVYSGEMPFEDFQKEYEKKYLNPDNILFKKYSKIENKEEGQTEKERKAIYRWLGLFGTFENYVKQLMFEPFFVKEKEGEYLILDMAESDIAAGKLVPLDIDTIKERRHLRIHKMEKGIPCTQMDEGKALETLLKNVKECTIKRSEAIEELLNERQE